jgi:hypothetical protein
MVLGTGVLLGLVARVTVFASGGVGGVLSVGVFHMFAAALAIAAVRYLVRGTQHREKVRWAWALATVASFELAVVTNGVAGASAVFTAFTMVCIVALIILGIATLTRRIRGAQP